MVFESIIVTLPGTSSTYLELRFAVTTISEIFTVSLKLMVCADSGLVRVMIVIIRKRKLTR
jgi:hypothetical protein